MKAFNIVVIALICCQKVIAGYVQPSNICLKNNEAYTTCGTACPLTCDNYNNPPKVCTKQCIIGCVCKSGYVRRNDSNCVLPRDCKPEVHQCTKEHEVYNACGSACPPTCDNHKNPPACTKQCVPGCYCVDGYVRNNAENCVNPSNCPQVQRCTDNEVYDKCGTDCPTTCQNYLNPPKIRTTSECIAGCVCKEGFIRDEMSCKCVLPSDCPEGYVCEPENVRNKTGQRVLPCEC